MKLNRDTKRRAGYGMILLGVLIAAFLVYAVTPAGQAVFQGPPPSIFGWLLPLVVIYQGWRWVRENP